MLDRKRFTTSLPASTSYRSGIDRILEVVLHASAAISGCVVLCILLFLVLESLPAFERIGLGRFLQDASWHPSEGRFGLLPMIAGTALTTAGAVAVAVPMGILSAAFCRFYAPRVLGAPYRRLIELLAGIPSVVYGFWGLSVLVPIIASYEPPGASLLAGVAVLALMILPTIALTADAGFETVPREFLDGAAALGLSRWTTVVRIALPAARGSVVTGVILGVGRAVGETMAVLMVCGNVVQVPESVFDPVRTLTANIALEMAYAVGDHRSSLFVSGLVLLAIVSALVVAGELVVRRDRHG